jgi:hypothetical protein
MFDESLALQKRLGPLATVALYRRENPWIEGELIH